MMISVRTLRGRLTLLYVGTLGLTIAICAFLVYAALSRNLYRHHDDELSRQAQQVIDTLGEGQLTEAAIRRTLIASSVRSRLVMIRNGQGELLYRDPVLDITQPEIGRHEALVHAAVVGMASPEFFTVKLDRTCDTRFICAPLRQPNMYLQIGDPLGDVQSLLHSTAMASLPFIAIALLASSVMGWFIAKRALAPVRAMTETLNDIQATDLARRVGVHPTDEELGGLVATLNHLLDRLQRAFESLRQFAGDVSHQLQTAVDGDESQRQRQSIRPRFARAPRGRNRPHERGGRGLEDLHTGSASSALVAINALLLKRTRLADSPPRRS